MTTVGVISDTHGRLLQAAYAALADSDVIIHAGDIGDSAILRELETLAPVYAVLGNNDYREYGESVGRFAHLVIDGVRFCVAHYPEDVGLGVGSRAAAGAGELIPRVRIHGHTHVPKLLAGSLASPSELLLCPGSASRPRGSVQPTIAHIELSQGWLLRATIETLSGAVMESWSR